MKLVSEILLLMVFGILVADCDGNAADSLQDASDETNASDDIATDSEQAELRGSCSLDKALGALEISVAEDYSSISGAFADSVAPATVPTLELEEGDCILWRRVNPYCNPSCESGKTCDFDGNCIPSPLQQDAGVITIDGLSDPVSIEPLAPTNSYFTAEISHPAFEPGDPIEMTTTDGYFGILNMRGVGVEPLIDSDLIWTIEVGQPLNVTWQAPAEDTGSRISLYLNIDLHGQSPLTMICDFPDTGHAVVSASLIDKLMNTGISGKPSGRLTRRTVDSLDVAEGCVEFLITSSLKATVQVVNVAQSTIEES
jgi:hypothetical protein